MNFLVLILIKSNIYTRWQSADITNEVLKNKTKIPNICSSTRMFPMSPFSTEIPTKRRFYIFTFALLLILFFKNNFSSGNDNFLLPGIKSFSALPKLFYLKNSSRHFLTLLVFCFHSLCFILFEMDDCCLH